MKLRSAGWHKLRRLPRTTGGASVRLPLLVLGAFIAGAAAGAYWLHRARLGPGSQSQTEAGAPAIALSESTRTVLKRLEGPLALRYYCMLDPASVPAATQGFAQRVDRLLAAYQQEAAGKLNLSRYESLSTDAAEAASADGIKAFNIAKGNACYLGVGLELKGHKDSLPELSPEWEPALESDLTRAIARLIEAVHPAGSVLVVSQVNTAAVQQVKALIPDLGAVSVAEGTRLLRESALKEFEAAAREMQARVKQAEQQLIEAQNSKSEAEQQAAIQNLQRIQAEQNQRLKEIAAKAQAQVQAFQELKAKP